MFFRKIVVITLLLTSFASNSYADAADDLTTQLISVSRQYQQETSQGKAKLKPTLQELSSLTSEYLGSLASTGAKPNAKLVDASHLINSLLNS